MRAIAVLVIGCLVAGCSGVPVPSSSPWGNSVATAGPEAEADRPVVARADGTITLMPISPRGAVVGVGYGYVMPHCGILSPIDVDGSFWDSADATTGTELMDGEPGTFRLIDEDTAVFTRPDDDNTLRLVRHEGAKAFGLCL